jgi:glycosyltransferase involved in cell wall biosynthesis
MHPLVSVRVATYNHEKYIAQCIEGILMQKTAFPVEVIIGEDCSTDKTCEIVFSYQRKHPEKIHVIATGKNIGPAQNSLRIQSACRGKYHAMCEGDDYWIDPLKLQKQVDFMEAHPEIPMCLHNAFWIDEAKNTARLFYPSPLKEILTFEEISRIFTPTASILARSSVIADLPEWRIHVWAGDLLFKLWCAHHGNLGYLNEIMSVYRKNPNGLSVKTSFKKASSEILKVYHEFDKATKYQHTIIIQACIRRRKEKQWRRRLGWFYYFFHPLRLYKIISDSNRIAQNRSARQ